MEQLPKKVSREEMEKLAKSVSKYYAKAWEKEIKFFEKQGIKKEDPRFMWDYAEILQEVMKKNYNQLYSTESTTDCNQL